MESMDCESTIILTSKLMVSVSPRIRPEPIGYLTMLERADVCFGRFHSIRKSLSNVPSLQGFTHCHGVGVHLDVVGKSAKRAATTATRREGAESRHARGSEVSSRSAPRHFGDLGARQWAE